MNEQIQQLVNEAGKILIIQADNPDADSLASALALEQILGEMDKDTHLYCGVDIPTYLRYLPGWDRVSPQIPNNFDLSIIVDASTMTLLEKLVQSNYQSKVANKPCIVLDHHAEVEKIVPFATVNLTQTDVASTGQLIYALAKEASWPLDKTSAEFIMTSILGDTQGLSNELAVADTYRVMAELIEMGANRPALEEQRREASKMHPDIFRYKAELIKRTEFHIDGRLAIVTIPQQEINTYSPLYNPAPLIQTDMLQTEGVGVTVVMKHYDDGKILGAIRCNQGSPIGAELAKAFGGGGHTYASGFKILGGRSIEEIKNEFIKKTQELLA